MNLSALFMLISFAYLIPGNTCTKIAPEPTGKHVSFKINKKSKRNKRFKPNELQILRQQLQQREAEQLRSFQERSRTKSLVA